MARQQKWSDKVLQKHFNILLKKKSKIVLRYKSIFLFTCHVASNSTEEIQKALKTSKRLLQRKWRCKRVAQGNSWALALYALEKRSLLTCLMHVLATLWNARQLFMNVCLGIFSPSWLRLKELIEINLSRVTHFAISFTWM